MEKEKELRLFVGGKADYYLSKWDAIEKTGNKASLNWAALIFSTFWMVYRKMYLYAFIIIGIWLVAAAVFIALSLFFDFSNSANKLIGEFIGVIPSIIILLYGNSLYHKHAKKKIVEIEERHSDPRMQEIEIARVGGTSWAGVAVFVVLCALFTAFIVGMVLISGLLNTSNVYENPTYGIKIEYPYDWQELEEIAPPLIVGFLSPEESAFPARLVIATEDLSARPINLEEYTNSTIGAYREDSSITIIDSSATMLANRPAHKLIDSKRGEQFDTKEMWVWTIKDNKAYAILYLVSPDSYSTYLSAAQKMIDSFEFIEAREPILR